MQGRSLLPVLRGRTPADWRSSMYYRYYHDPGDHNTRAHYGVRTRTHKLIYFWKKDQWELFDLAADPLELHNLYGEPGHEQLTAGLKAELAAAEAGRARRRPVRQRTAAERRRWRGRRSCEGNRSSAVASCQLPGLAALPEQRVAVLKLADDWKLAEAGTTSVRHRVTVPPRIGPREPVPRRRIDHDHGRAARHAERPQPAHVVPP